MRILIICLIAFLAACNGSDNDSAYATTAQLSQQIAQLQTEVSKLQSAPSESTEVAALRASLKKLQLVGSVRATASVQDFRTMGEVLQGSTPNFGPCTDMGVLLGRAVSSFTTDPLAASAEAFQTCTGYEYSVVVGTASIAIAPRIFWDGPNCTGNMLEWPASGGSYNSQTLNGGVVFINPADGTSVLMVKAGQTPQPIFIQSAWVTSNPGCQTDQEMQLMYLVTPNDTSITGVSETIPSNFQLTSP